MSVRAYLSLGSNLGDRIGYLASSVRALAEAGRRPARDGERAVEVRAVSPVYETAPIGNDGDLLRDHPPYLNCAVAIATQLTAPELWWLCSGIEAALGRVRGDAVLSRTADIDLLLFGEERVQLEHLTIPHPRMCDRAFVLRPLLDLEPTLVAPGLGSLAAYLQRVAHQDCVKYLPAHKFMARVRETIDLFIRSRGSGDAVTGESRASSPAQPSRQACESAGVVTREPHRTPPTLLDIALPTSTETLPAWRRERQDRLSGVLSRPGSPAPRRPPAHGPPPASAPAPPVPAGSGPRGRGCA